MLLWKTGTVEMRIWPNDHCPPHVTAVCRPDSWTARFVFSMLTDDVSLSDIKPKQNAPSYGVVCQSQADEPDGSIVPESGIYVPGLGVRAQINWGNQVTTELLKEV